MSNKVDKDTAESEFERFIDSMDIDADLAEMDDEDKASFNKHKARMLKAIQNGALTFNDDGEAVYMPQNPKSGHNEPITFHERTGASLMAMDGKKKNQDAAKLYAIMGDLCKVHPKTFSNMVGVDIKLCESIFALLMD